MQSAQAFIQIMGICRGWNRANSHVSSIIFVYLVVCDIVLDRERIFEVVRGLAASSASVKTVITPPEPMDVDLEAEWTKDMDMSRGPPLHWCVRHLAGHWEEEL